MKKWTTMAQWPSAMSMEIISAKRVNCNHRTPVNPVNPSFFINSQWKAYQRLRPLIAKADTRTENGILSTGSTKFDNQNIKFKNQVDLQGWPREGRATTRYICDLLSATTNGLSRFCPATRKYETRSSRTTDLNKATQGLSAPLWSTLAATPPVWPCIRQ